MTAAAPERKESLWPLVAGPAIWAVRFVVVYAFSAVWCARFATDEGSFAVARAVHLVTAAIALAALAVLGWRGHRRHRRDVGAGPHARDDDAARHRFLGYATLLLALLSGLAVVYEVLVVAYVGSCH